LSVLRRSSSRAIEVKWESLIAHSDFCTKDRRFLGPYRRDVKKLGFTLLRCLLIVGLCFVPPGVSQADVTGGGPRTVPPASSIAGFTPAEIPGLAAWYDASDPLTISLSAQLVAALQDRSGNGNVLAQTSASRLPAYRADLAAAGSLSFGGSAFLTSNNADFSNDLFNESTVFVVTSQTTSATGTALASGATSGSPAYGLRFGDRGTVQFDFNNAAAGRLSATATSSGPAVWTAAGSVSQSRQLLRENGVTLASGRGPGAVVSGSYPLVVGAAQNGSLRFTGAIAEVLVYHRFLSASEQVQTETYLACKWYLQSRLPNGVQCPTGLAVSRLSVNATRVQPGPISRRPPGALPDPPQLVSANGSLTVNLIAAQNASGVPQLLYNGYAIPPTLRLLPGDTLVVNITNILPTPPQGAGYLNDVSLHYHGLQVSPNAPGDDSIDMIATPGQSLHYSIPIPAEHPTGLYWYHSHAHGEAQRQDLAGMSGALIIDGIAQSVPQVATMPERILVVREQQPAGVALPASSQRQILAMRWAMAHEPRSALRGVPLDRMSMYLPEIRSATTRRPHNPYVTVDANYRRFRRPLSTDTHCQGSEAAPSVWTINGVVNPSIGIKPGEKQFWRLVNAGANSYLDIAVDNASLQLVALDGEPLSSGVNTPSTLTVSDYVLPPSSRAEFIVTGPPAGTQAYVRTLCYDAGSAGPAMPAAILASIDPLHSPVALTRAQGRFVRRTARSAQYHSVRFITTQPIAEYQTVTYSDQNTINGVAYDPSAAPLFYAQSGTVQEWTIVNNSYQVHTFHMHQVHFVVASVNGVAPANQFVMDNVNIPSATANGPATVKLLIDFTNPVIIGTFLVHCHILSHEDGGMMAKIRVGTAPPMTTNPTQVTFASKVAASQNVAISGGTAPYSVSGCANVANGTISGSTLTISPVGGGSCTLTIEDSTGLVASVSVTVNVPATIVLSPTSVGFANPAATPAAIAISGGLAPYGATGCSGVATSAISGSTLTVTPTGSGSCTLGVTDAATDTASLPVSVNGSYSTNPADNITFHQNALRTGWYQSETALNTTTVASASFSKIATLTATGSYPAMGKVYAQPLYVTSERTSDGNTHNLVIVATSTDQIYAFDDTTYAVVWERNFVSGSGVRQQLSTDTGCNDVNPNVGITGTPVIDRTADRLYVVVPTYESGVFHQRLHAIALASGLDVVTAVEVTGTTTLSGGGTATTNPENNFNRGALLEANNTIYVPLGSHCDGQASTTHGWVLGYNATTLAAAGNLVNVTDQNSGSSYFLGAPWMSGFGPASDAQGNIYFATGNGPWNGTTNFAMSVLKVPGSLNLASATYFTPAGEAADSNADADLGSGGVLLFPDVSGAYPHLAIAGGKCGAGGSGTSGCVKYLLNRDSLGGQQTGDAGALWHPSTGGGMWGGPAYFQDTSGNSYIIYGGGNPLSTYKLTTSSSTPTLTSVASVTVSGPNGSCLECRNQGSQPIVSSYGTNSGTAIVWALQTPGNSGGAITLKAFNALTMTQLYSGAAGTWTMGSGASYIGGALVSPLVANGKVYVPTDGSVAVFGL
jgi:suppressor of ftsI